MKKKLVKLFFLLFIFTGAGYVAPAQIYVRIRPSVPVVVRPPRPSHLHVWIGNEWEPNGDGYRYSGSHWDTPPHDRDRYNHGHWQHHDHDGLIWIHGEWRKRR